MSLVTAFRIELDEHLVLLSGDFAGGALTATDADAAYLRLDGTNDPLTGAVTIADDASALDSGAYTFQTTSNVTDGVGAVAYQHKITNVFADGNGAKAFSYVEGGSDKNVFSLTLRNDGITIPGFGTRNTLAIGDGTGDAFLDVEITGTGILGGYYFTSGTASAGFFPTTSVLVNTTGNQAGFSIVGTGSIGNPQIGVSVFTTNTALQPTGSEGHLMTIGIHSGDEATNKFSGLFLSDDSPVSFGNDADATIQWNSTNNALEIGASASESIAFYGGSGTALQTGVAVTAAAIHAALVNLNLITA